MAGLGAFYELQVRCSGVPDPTTGYLMNIRSVDDAVRQLALPVIEQAFRRGDGRSAESLLPSIITAIAPALNDSVTSIRWWLTPYHSLAMRADAQDRVLITQQFEFAAAHRLSSSALDEQQNRATFGKCNNVHGHGHNYRVETAVSRPLNGAAGRQILDLAELERLVDETIIQRFDHKHLNLDTAEFSKLNPSVEHIAKVCYDLLRGPIERAGGRLEHVTLWETAKTSCTYPARGADA